MKPFENANTLNMGETNGSYIVKSIAFCADTLKWLLKPFYVYSDVIIAYMPNSTVNSSRPAIITASKQFTNSAMSFSVYISSLINDGFFSFMLSNLPDYFDFFCSD